MADAAREDRERLGKRRLAEFIAECEEASESERRREERNQRRAEERREEMEAERRRRIERRAEPRAETRAAPSGVDWQPEGHIEPAPESPPRDVTDGVPSEPTASAPSGGSSGDRAAELSELEALKKFFAAFDALITNRDVKATWEMIERLPVDVGPPGTTLRDCYRKARGLIDAGSDSA